MRWQDIEKADEDKEIRIKGFLFQNEQGDWLLSSEANLKSCCVGSPQKKSSQIILLGDYERPRENRAAFVEGKLHRENETLYLKNTSITQAEPFPFRTVALLCLCLILLGNKKARRRLSLRR